MLLIAHRGASGYAPENTKAAFQVALDLGAKAIELDIHQTKDKKLAVIHDDTLKRTAGISKEIRTLTYKELASYDVGSWFDPRFSSERAPLLEEVLDWVKDRAELHIEIKRGGTTYPDIEQRLLGLLISKKLLEKVVVSSFNVETLKCLRSLEKNLRIGYLIDSDPPKQVRENSQAIRPESLHLSLSQAKPVWARLAEECKLPFLVYTVDSPEELEKLKKMGASGVFTNYPDLDSIHWKKLGGTES